MKTMTCKQLGGACDQKFQAETFEEIADLSRQHGLEMFKQADHGHLEAMNKMKDLMMDPDMMQKWMEDKKSEFNSLPED